MSMVLPNKFFKKESMQQWEKMLENSFNFSTIMFGTYTNS